jgi:hypothetical protein
VLSRNEVQRLFAALSGTQSARRPSAVWQ